MGTKVGKGILATVAVCGALLVAYQSNTDVQAASKQTYNVVIPAEAGSIDLSLASDSYSFNILNNVDEGLYRLDKNNNAQIAGASEAATVSEDGLTYTVKLRQDAKWSNGDSVTAKDYVYAWQRTVDPKTGAEYSYMFSPVKNADDITAGKKDKSELGIKAVDDYTLEITLAKTTPYFTQLLAFPSYFPQNQKVAEQYGNDYAKTSTKQVYNGPFTLKSFSGAGTDTSWKLVKNSSYWDAKSVKLSTINFDVVKETSTALGLFNDKQADDIQLSGELAKQNADNKNFVSVPGATTQYLEMNQAKAGSPFKNANFRKAISYAMNRKQIVNNILGDGSVTVNGLVPKGLAYNPETKADFTKDVSTTLKYNKKQAKAYYKKALKELGKKSISINLLTSDTESSKKLGEYIQGALQDDFSGLKVTISNVPLSVRLDRSNSGKFDMVMNNWIADYADPSNFLELFTSDSSYNRGKWSNADYDALVDKAANADAADEKARYQDMIQADELLTKEMGVVPLYQMSEAHLRASKVKGVVSHSAGASYDYKWTYIK